MGIRGIVAAAEPHKIKAMGHKIKQMAMQDWRGNPVPFDVSFVEVL